MLFLLRLLFRPFTVRVACYLVCGMDAACNHAQDSSILIFLITGNPWRLSNFCCCNGAVGLKFSHYYAMKQNSIQQQDVAMQRREVSAF